jgi:hypothetical protein
MKKLLFGFLTMMVTQQVYPEDMLEFKDKSIINFETTQKEMISFHMLKVADHQKVVDCLKKANDFDSMNDCNKHLEKYIKKDVDEGANKEVD